MILFLNYEKSVSYHYQFSSVQSVSRVWVFATPWMAARLASLSSTNSQSLFKLMSIESLMPSSHLILCRPLLLLPAIFPSIRVFSSESVLHIRWPKYLLELQLQYQFFQWIFRTDFLQDGLVGSPRIPRDSQESFATPVQKHQFFGAQLSLWSSSHIHTWLLEKPKLRLHGHLLAK